METFIGEMVMNPSDRKPEFQTQLVIKQIGKHMAMGWYLGAQAMKMAISIGFLGHKLGSMI